MISILYRVHTAHTHTHDGPYIHRWIHGKKKICKNQLKLSFWASLHVFMFVSDDYSTFHLKKESERTYTPTTKHVQLFIQKNKNVVWATGTAFLRQTFQSMHTRLSFFYCIILLHQSLSYAVLYIFTFHRYFNVFSTNIVFSGIKMP